LPRKEHKPYKPVTKTGFWSTLWPVKRVEEIKKDKEKLRRG